MIQPLLLIDQWKTILSLIGNQQSIFDLTGLNAASAIDISCQGHSVWVYDSAPALRILARLKSRSAAVVVVDDFDTVAETFDVVVGLVGLVNRYTHHQAALQQWLVGLGRLLKPQALLIIDCFFTADCDSWSEQANLLVYDADFVCYQRRDYGESGYAARQERVWFQSTSDGWQRGGDDHLITAIDQAAFDAVLQPYFSILRCVSFAKGHALYVLQSY